MARYRRFTQMRVRGEKGRRIAKRPLNFRLRNPSNAFRQVVFVPIERPFCHTMTINGPWRICFRFEDGHASDVEIGDYH